MFSFCFHFTLIIEVLSFNFAKGGITFAEFKSFPNIHQNDPKLWSEYVYMFLSESHRKPIFGGKVNLVHFLFESFKSIKLFKATTAVTEMTGKFCSSSSSRVGRPSGRIVSSYLTYFDCDIPKDHLKTVHRAVYCLPIRLDICHAPKCSRYRIFHSFKWIFMLHKVFSVNLTFHSLHISAETPDNCTFGNLSVSTANQSRKLATLCGQRPNFNVYPAFSDITIKLDFLKCKLFQINSSFWILEKGLVSSFHKVTTGTNLKPTDTLVFQGYLTFISYFIEVKKIDKIILNLTSSTSEYVLFDGPHVFANIVRCPGGVCSTTHFQCFLQILSNTNTNVTGVFGFSSRRVGITHHRNVFDNKITALDLPGSDCSGTVCAVHIVSQFCCHVNVSVNKMIYNGEFRPTCRHGGFVAAELSTQLYKENPTICSHLNEDKVQVVLFIPTTVPCFSFCIITHILAK